MSELKRGLRHLAANILVKTPLFKSYREKGAPFRVLMYHRIADPERLPVKIQPGMYVRPATFQMHLEYLDRNCNVISIDDLVQHFVNNEPVPRNTVCLTFDDGWVDNYQNAFPILKEFGFPATIFLVTGFIGTQEIFWVDRLSLSLGQSQLKKHSDLDLSYVQSMERVLDPPTYQELYKAYASTAREDEVILLDKLAKIFIQVPAAHRAQLLSRLYRIIPPRVLNTFPRSFMSWEEVLQMYQQGISFGSHTHTHQLMTDLDPDQSAAEITTSYETLTSKGIQPSQVFCYPNGLFNTQSQKILTRSGVRFALVPGEMTDMSKSPYLLGRVGIHQDVASSQALFATRLWANQLF